MGDSQDYNSGMAHQGLGYAFFRPESSTRVKIGTCGYIDGSGAWHTIVDCSNNTANEKAGYSAINMNQLLEVDSSKQLWGPQCTETVTRNTFEVKAGTTLPTEFGAVLLCKGFVTKQCYDLFDPFRDWARANIERILANVSDIRRHGFYIILSTFCAPEVIVNAWRGKSQKKTLGFSCEVDEIGQLGTHIDIYGAHDSDGWVAYPLQDQKEYVVFFGGLKYNYHTLTGWMRKVNMITSFQNAGGDKVEEIPQEKWRGDNLIFRDPDFEENAIEVEECEIGSQ